MFNRQDLVKLIFDMKLMTKTAVELEYDINKMPLGQLTKATLLQGFDVLKQLDETIEKLNKEKAKAKQAALRDQCEQLSSAFYTVIPHAFGRQRPPVVSTSEQLATKVKMVETLAEIQIATKLMSEDTEGMHELDSNFAKLKCDMEVLDEKCDEFKMIEAYTSNTYETGNAFGYGAAQKAPAIDAVYKLTREGEDARFKTKAKLGNRKLLWHGSRITNYVGILSQGLRIAPPEAPCSGYRFGKGVYVPRLYLFGKVSNLLYL
jgi:poly [ADP-ribose] polymerase